MIVNALIPGKPGMKPGKKSEPKFLGFCYSLLQNPGTFIRVDNVSS